MFAPLLPSTHVFIQYQPCRFLIRLIIQLNIILTICLVSSTLYFVHYLSWYEIECQNCVLLVILFFFHFWFDFFFFSILFESLVKLCAYQLSIKRVSHLIRRPQALNLHLTADIKSNFMNRKKKKKLKITHKANS